jgi:hypothetical protein
MSGFFKKVLMMSQDFFINDSNYAAKKIIEHNSYMAR